MRFAVLTDIHANREAFQSVLDDLADRSIDRIAILAMWWATAPIRNGAPTR